MVQSVSNEDLASMVVKLSADLTVYSKEMSKVAGIAEKAINGAAKAWGAGNEKMAGQTTKAAQQMDRAYRAAGASAGNMAAQVQDIGIQLQSGTSPITVALQQGTQIGQIFAQAGQQGGNAFTVMLGALKNLLSPAAILPILFIAIGGAVIQAFSKSKKSIEETLKELENLKKIANEIDNRVGHLQSAAVHLGLAEQCDLQTLPELFLPPRLVEEHDLQAPTAIADDGVDHGAAIAHRAFRHTAHTDQHQCFLTWQQVTDPRLVGAIHPTARIGREQVEHGVDANVVQRRQLLLADTLDPLHADRVEITQRQRFDHSTPNRYGYNGWPPR